MLSCCRGAIPDDSSAADHIEGAAYMLNAACSHHPTPLFNTLAKTYTFGVHNDEVYIGYVYRVPYMYFAPSDATIHNLTAAVETVQECKSNIEIFMGQTHHLTTFVREIGVDPDHTQKLRLHRIQSRRTIDGRLEPTVASLVRNLLGYTRRDL